ncbi:MAG: polysaccharide biosynthesis/export family protein [Limisphaerales bacterium]
MLNSIFQKTTGIAVAAVALWLGFVSAQAAPSDSSATTNQAPANPDSLILKEGDSIHISFPGTPSLNSTQVIRRDGKITLDMVGEVSAAGLTPHALEEELIKRYGDQLVVKEIFVTVESSSFVVYLTGAVLKPGKLVSERHLSPMEAVIEAGIDHTRANLKSVVIIRDLPTGKREKFKLNLARQLKGEPTVPFSLEPFDIIYVPERFSWY